MGLREGFSEEVALEMRIAFSRSDLGERDLGRGTVKT